MKKHATQSFLDGLRTFPEQPIMTYDRIVAVNGRHGRAIELEGRFFA